MGEELSGTISAGSYMLIAGEDPFFNSDGDELYAGEDIDNSVFADISLSSSSDEIDLLDANGDEVDYVEYGDGWTLDRGHAVELINPSLDNSDPMNWVSADSDCLSDLLYGEDGDDEDLENFGSPAMMNCSYEEPEMSAFIQVIHNSASPTVDIYVDGELAVEGFEYRTASPVFEVETSFTVGIAPTGGDIIADFPITLEDGGEYVVMATGLLGSEDTPFTLATTSTTFGASEGYVGLEAYHGSTDAPAVDILANGDVLVSNLAYGDFSGYVEVPAASYTVGIAPTGGAVIAEFEAPLSGLGGASAVVFASGFLSGDDPAFGLFAALQDGQVLELTNIPLSVDEFDNMPVSYSINSAYPNPFNPSTTINYSVPVVSEVKLAVFDMLGREVAILTNEIKQAGNHTFEWNAIDMPSGFYFVTMTSNDFKTTKKVTLIK